MAKAIGSYKDGALKSLDETDKQDMGGEIGLLATQIVQRMGLTSTEAEAASSPWQGLGLCLRDREDKQTATHTEPC